MSNVRRHSALHTALADTLKRMAQARLDGETVVIDVGQNLLGVYSVHNRRYVAYRGQSISQGVRRLECAYEVVSFNGRIYDLPELQRMGATARGAPVVMRGIHTDMIDICWGNILGSGLRNTYYEHTERPPPYPNTHEGSNRNDIYMTLKLWRWWKQGKLRRINGHPTNSAARIRAA